MWKPFEHTSIRHKVRMRVWKRCSNCSIVKGKKCDAIQGTIKEAEGLIKKTKEHTVRDAALLAAASAVEHYKISRYGTLSAWAQKLGLPEAAQLLDETLHERADEKLSKLTVFEINVRANSEIHDKSTIKTIMTSKAERLLHHV